MEEDLSWIAAMRDVAQWPTLVERIKRHLHDLTLALPEEDRPAEHAIEKVLHQLKNRDADARRKVRGEAAEIVDRNDNPGPVTEIGIAHLLGLRHRTANAFVVTPRGTIVCQRRAHNKRFAFYLSIYGGHVKAPADYEAAIREELGEELELSHFPEGELRLISKNIYKQAGDLNVEIQALFRYRLTEAEDLQVQRSSKAREEEKRQRTRAEYKDWLQAQQIPGSGRGEVWGVYEVDSKRLTNAPYREVFVPDLNRTIELHYITLVDRFKDQQTVDEAYFTPDLLERAVWNPDVLHALRP